MKGWVIALAALALTGNALATRRSIHRRSLRASRYT